MKYISNQLTKGSKQLTSKLNQSVIVEVAIETESGAYFMTVSTIIHM